MVISAFEEPPSILSFLATHIVYIGYGHLKNETFSFSLSIAELLLYIFISCDCIMNSSLSYAIY
jgi:hypothetical protein